MNTAVKSMTKGSNCVLPDGITSLVVGLSWEAPAQNFDLDAWTFLLDANDTVPSDEHFVFFNNSISPCGSVIASEDNEQGGSGDEDDETVTVDLNKVPSTISKIVFIVNIHDAKKRGQSFGDLDNAGIRLCDSDGVEFARYDLGQDDVTDEASLIFGELYRHSGAWKFRAIAQGDTNGPAKLVRVYGVNLDDDSDSQDELPVSVPTPPVQAPAPKLNLSKGTIKMTKPGAKINIAKTRSMQFSVWWTKSHKDLGLVVQVSRTTDVKKSEFLEGGEYFDWSNLDDKKGAIHHHGDRKKTDPDICERVTLKLGNDPTITAVAIMAYSELSNGMGSFRSMGTTALVDDGEGTQVSVDLNKGGMSSYYTVIAVVIVNEDGSLSVERTSRFSASGTERRPQIDKAGNVIMNKGPRVFKPASSW